MRRNAELTAFNLLRMAKVLQDNPYDISIKMHNATMKKRNQVKMQAVAFMREDMPD